MKFLHFGLLVSAVRHLDRGLQQRTRATPAGRRAHGGGRAGIDIQSTVAAGRGRQPGMPQQVVQASVATVSLPPHPEPEPTRLLRSEASISTSTISR